MVDFLQTAGELTGMSGGGGGGFDTTLVLIFVLVGLFSIAMTGFATWFLIRWYQYKYKIVLFQRINGQFQETARLKARVVPVGKGSDTALLLNRPAKILPMPSIQSGKNTFNYFVSDDQEWINFKFGDFDEDRRQVGSQFLDKEMRYARTSLQHMGEERYNVKGFWDKYGGLIAYVTLILITCIGLWMIVDKMVEFQQTSTGAMETINLVMDKADKILGKVANVDAGGTGLISAK